MDVAYQTLPLYIFFEYSIKTELMNMTYNQTNITQQRTRTKSTRFTTNELPSISDHEQQESLYKLRDYVNAFIVNEAGEILVLEGGENGRSWASWQMIGRTLKSNEDPMAAVQEDLLKRTGYICENWIYLGTFVVNDTKQTGAGHFFCAKMTDRVPLPEITSNLDSKHRWVSKKEIKQAMLDGRIAVINHAVAVSLAMMMCNQE